MGTPSKPPTSPGITSRRDTTSSRWQSITSTSGRAFQWRLKYITSSVGSFPSRALPGSNRADQLHKEYVLTAKGQEGGHNLLGDTTRPGGSRWAQAAQLRKGEGAGVWGFLGGQPTCSSAWDFLATSLATSRVSEANGRAKEGQDPGGEVCAGGEGHDEGQVCLKLSIASIRAQCISLHRSLELISNGLVEATARSAALAMAHTMEKNRATFLQTLCAPKQGVRRGFKKVEWFDTDKSYLKKNGTETSSSALKLNKDDFKWIIF